MGEFTAQLAPPTVKGKLLPVTVMALSVNGAVPTLLTVTSCTPENEPTVIEPNAKAAGVT